jgi:hypothetical protein
MNLAEPKVGPEVRHVTTTTYECGHCGAIFSYEQFARHVEWHDTLRSFARQLVSLGLPDGPAYSSEWLNTLVEKL